MPWRMPARARASAALRFDVLQGLVPSGPRMAVWMKRLGALPALDAGAWPGTCRRA